MIRTMFGKRTVWLFGVLLMTLSAAATSQQPSGQQPSQPDQLSEQDLAFMKKAAVGGRLEIELGKLAQDRAEAPEVRQFGSRMVKEHQMAAKNMKQRAMQMDVSLPQSLPRRQQALKDALAELEGETFDEQYMWNMVAAHTVAVNVFEEQVSEGDNPEFVALAEKMLPTLKDHRERAVELWNNINEL